MPVRIHQLCPAQCALPRQPPLLGVLGSLGLGNCHPRCYPRCATALGGLGWPAPAAAAPPAASPHPVPPQGPVWRGAMTLPPLVLIAHLLVSAMLRLLQAALVHRLALRPRFAPHRPPRQLLLLVVRHCVSQHLLRQHTLV